MDSENSSDDCSDVERGGERVQVRLIVLIRCLTLLFH